MICREAHKSIQQRLIPQSKFDDTVIDKAVAARYAKEMLMGDEFLVEIQIEP